MKRRDLFKLLLGAVAAPGALLAATTKPKIAHGIVFGADFSGTRDVVCAWCRRRADAAEAFAGACAATGKIPLASAKAAEAFAAVANYKGPRWDGQNYVPREMQLRVYEGEAVTPRGYNGEINMAALDLRGIEAMLKQPGNRRAVRAAAERRRRELGRSLQDMSARIVEAELKANPNHIRRWAASVTGSQLEQGGYLYHLLFCKGGAR